MGTSTVSDHVPATLHHDKSVAANETKSNRKSTASAMAKLLLRGVRDSADAFGPLRSVAGGLCFILENYEVLFPSRLCYPMLTGAPENEGKYTSDRIFGTPSQSAHRITLRICF